VILYLGNLTFLYSGGAVKKLLILLSVGLLSPSISFAKNEVNDRVVHAAVVLKEISEAPDKGVPQDLLDKCACVAVIPGLKKGGFILGAAYGKGLMSCRTNMGDGPWSPPSMLLLEGGSFGLQIGVQSVDLILVIMNVSGLESLLDSKFTLGGDASVAAGPVGRTAAAETDAWMSAKILAYSRAKGLFGGLVLKGGVIRADNDANQVLYGKQMEPRNVLLHQSAEPVPKDAKIFLDELNRISPKHVSDQKPPEAKKDQGK
jgi:lipid-binding SYLF domain-containing protein